MAIYTIHGRAAEPDEPRFIREGFSWPALLFGPFWLAAKGLWIVLAVVLAFELMVMTLGAAFHLGGAALLPVFLGIHLLLGLEGANLLRWSLGLRGYREIAIEAGSSLEEAERRYFDSRPGPQVAPPTTGRPPPPRAAHEADALGLFSPPNTP